MQVHQIRSIFVILLICCACLSGCAGLSKGNNPRLHAESLAQKKNFFPTLVKTKSFNLTTYSNVERKIDKPLTVYIEGDGHAWESRYQISTDPSPYNPMGLKLALLDPNPNVVYLARPCQYTPHSLDPLCHPKYWTDARFSETVIASMNDAIQQLKQKTKTKKVHLVGFSGGAAVAVLIAARRNDVTHLITVAGDLDHEAMSQFHKTTPIADSLNPIKVASKITHIPQHHYIGDKDPIVPTFISDSFVKEIMQSKEGLKNKDHNHNHIQRTVLKNVTHHEGWEAFFAKAHDKPFL